MGECGGVLGRVSRSGALGLGLYNRQGLRELGLGPQSPSSLYNLYGLSPGSLIGMYNDNRKKTERHWHDKQNRLYNAHSFDSARSR